MITKFNILLLMFLSFSSMPLEPPLEYTNGNPMSESVAKQSYFFLVPNALDELQVLFFMSPRGKYVVALQFSLWPWFECLVWNVDEMKLKVKSSSNWNHTRNKYCFNVYLHIWALSKFHQSYASIIKCLYVCLCMSFAYTGWEEVTHTRYNTLGSQHCFALKDKLFEKKRSIIIALLC